MRLSHPFLSIPLAVLVVFPFACKAPTAKSVSAASDNVLVHNGKRLRLVRRATPSELEMASRRLPLGPGDEVWYYETVLEFLGSETGFCLLREGKIVVRYFISAS